MARTTQTELPRSWELVIPDWHPTPANRLIGCHWGTAARRKKQDREFIAVYARVANIPPASGKRRVTVTLVRGDGQRGKDLDPDAIFKSLLDACVHAGLLLDDGPHEVELAPVRYERGPRRATRILLEDVEP